MNTKLRQIADHYGLDHQLGKLEEEAKELAEAANDYKFYRMPQELEHMLEEIADVQNVIYQIEYLLRESGVSTVSATVQSVRRDKIERQLERMEKEKTHE